MITIELLRAVQADRERHLASRTHARAVEQAVRRVRINRRGQDR